MGSDCHIDLLLAPILAMLEIHQPRGLPKMKSQLDLRLFDVGAPSIILAWFPYISKICLGSNYKHKRGMQWYLQKARKGAW